MVILLILNLGKSRFSTTHAFEMGIFDGCKGEKIRRFTINIRDLPSNFNLSASALVTNVESDLLSSSALTFIETSPFDT